MSVIKRVPFTHNQKDYEVRVSQTTDGYVVRAYHDGNPADGYRYNVDQMTNYDHKTYTGIDVFENLIKVAKQAVEDDMWNKCMKAIREK